jgi:hypothetical protein
MRVRSHCVVQALQHDPNTKVKSMLTVTPGSEQVCVYCITYCVACAERGGV